MAIQEADQTHNPTVEELIGAGQRLGIRCHSCGRFRYLNAQRFPRAQTLLDIGSQLKCARCGAKDAAAVAVAREPDNGFWPAESS